MRGLFVTGTDTDVGKTFVTSLILKSLHEQSYRVGAYKPACSGAVYNETKGNIVWEDRQFLSKAIGDKFPVEWVCPQCFEAPLAPPVAATKENRVIDEDLLFEGMKVWNDQVKGIVVEGVGGWKCPLSESLTIEHFAQRISFPVLIVAGQKLGVINHTLLTIDAVQKAGLKIAGVILNNFCSDSDDFINSNAQQILQFSAIPFLAVAERDHSTALRCHTSGTVIDFWNLMELSDHYND